MKANTSLSANAGGAVHVNIRQRGKRGRFSPPSPFLKLFSNRSGSTFFDLIIKMLVVITLMATVISFLGVFTTYLNLNHVCRRVVRVVELEGQISDKAYEVFYQLKQQTGLSPEMSIENVQYCDGTNQKIQLRDTFTITMKSSHTFTIFSPSFGPPVEINIPMRVSITGMSEKFWKLTE